MGDVFVSNGDSAQDTAVLLLDAAESAELPADVVRTTSGGFVVDEELAKSAGVDFDSEASSSDEAARNAELAAQAENEPEQESAEEPKQAAKKATAKKATAKKAAKKSSSK